MTCRQSNTSSFNDLFDRIWRPQSIAFSYVIYGIEPVEQELYDGGSEVVAAYLAELRRLKGELKRENPTLTALRASGILGPYKEQTNDKTNGS